MIEVKGGNQRISKQDISGSGYLERLNWWSDILIITT